VPGFMWNTSILATHVRVDGPVETRIVVSDVTAAAHVMVGVVIVRVEDLISAKRIAAIWRDAAVYLYRLPPVARSDRPRKRKGECSTGLSIQIGPDAAVRQDLIPTSSATAPHLRIQTGPLVWLIMDRTAFEKTRQAWEDVVHQLS
jgi:hypothetical protein